VKRSYGRRKAGQSLPLLALMMVFVIGMVGLSVDVGSAYSQERRMQNNANAAALTGMNTVVSAAGGQRASNEQVWQNIRLSTAGNQVNNQADDYIYYVDYIVDNGGKTLERIRLADWNGYTQDIRPGLAPENIVRMQVTMEHRVPAYFTRVVGWNDFNVNVEGSACLGGYGLGVLSLGVPQNLVAKDDAGQPYHVILDTKGKTLSALDPRWGNWNEMEDMTITFPVRTGTSGVPGTHVPWLSWGGSNGNPDLKAGMTYPGTLHEGFVEATPMDSRLPNTAPFKKLTLGDWVNGDTGLRAGALRPELDKLRQDQTEFALPIYDYAGAEGQTAFHVVRMGRFKLVNFDITGTNGFIQLQFLGDKNYSVTECVAPPPPIPPTYNLTGQVQFSEVYGERPKRVVPTSYDVLIVMDTSGSMGFDWYDQERGATYARMNDARAAIASIVRGYDVENDPDARMALVTFGGKKASTQVDWKTSGCPKPDDDDDDDDNDDDGDDGDDDGDDGDDEDEKCSDDDKWKQIQQKAAGLKYDGATPGPLAFELIQELLKKKRTPPAGKRYGQIVIFATDGVFNVCGKYTEPLPDINPCPAGGYVPPTPAPLADGTPYESYTNNAAYNLMPGRPVWQAQKVAAQIKATGARIFTIALKATCLPTIPSCFNPAGLSEMSSGSGYSFQANDGAALATIYETILEKITVEDGECVPGSVPLRAAPGAQVKLTQPQNPTWSEVVTADPNGNYSFSGLKAGLYTVTVDPAFQYTSTGKDGVTRTYPRLVNARNPNEENKASVDINGKRPDGATFSNNLELYIGNDENGVPKNGCSK
jgi:hypothetical protein